MTQARRHRGNAHRSIRSYYEHGASPSTSASVARVIRYLHEFRYELNRSEAILREQVYRPVRRPIRACERTTLGHVFECGDDSDHTR
jgi:hypothetical protein